MAFSVFNGKATWDNAGKSFVTFTNVADPVTTNSAVVVAAPSSSVVWVGDALEGDEDLHERASGGELGFRASWGATESPFIAMHR